MKEILIPTGDPAGIGPDISLMLPDELKQQVILIGNGGMLRQRAKLLGLKVDLAEVEAGAKPDKRLYATETNKKTNINNAPLRFIDVPLDKKVRPGKPDIANNAYILNVLHKAIELCGSGDYSTMLTAPISKEIINQSIPFIGLTEFLQDNCYPDAKDDDGSKGSSYLTRPSKQKTRPRDLLRLFCGQVNGSAFDKEAQGAIGVKEIKELKELRVSFASMHISLSAVAKTLNQQSVEKTIRSTNAVLQKYFSGDGRAGTSSNKPKPSGVKKMPHLALCGLNPHAGEKGLLGGEEVKWLGPLSKKLRDEGFNLSKPLAADSLFAPINLANYDAVIALYHDQGLAPFKALTFGKGAQVTFGLPFLRLSPDHGAAFALAGSGMAQGSSMEYAVKLGIRLGQRFPQRRRRPAKG